MIKKCIISLSSMYDYLTSLGTFYYRIHDVRFTLNSLCNKPCKVFFRAGLYVLMCTMQTYCSDEFLDFFDAADISPTTYALCNSPNVNPIDVITLLIDDLDALCILQQNFYLRTNELNQRSLLDYGIFLPQKYCGSPWDVGAHFFYNQTTRDNYTRTSTKLCSYLAIFQETFLQEIQRRIDDLDLDLPIDLRSAVPLFANMTVQERRTGFMFHGMRRWGACRLRFWFPFYYNESNFFLTPEELDRIEDELGVVDPAESTDFARRHLIADSFGFGDTRLNFDFPLVTNVGPMATKWGFLATIPTAFAFKKGLYGTHFNKLCKGPLLDFCKLFDLAVEERDFLAIANIGEQFAFCALDHFAANLVQTPMGNGGHLGFGAYVRSKTPLSTLIHRPWAQHINIHSRLTVEYLFAKRQTRYFIQKCLKEEFAAMGLDRNPSTILEQANQDPTYARAVLGFLEHQFTDRIFPFALHVRVQPGLIFRWITKYMYEGQHWGYFIGSDTWLTTKEKLYHIDIPKNIARPVNKTIAQKPFGYQVGVMGNFFWKRPNNLLLSINAEYNFSSVGIGSDFILSLNLEKLF